MNPKIFDSRVSRDAAVIIPTYGDKSFWEPYAENAFDSALAQTNIPYVIWLHDDEGSAASVRNVAARYVPRDVESLIFLDADDELDERYVEVMLSGVGDILQPSTLGIYPDRTTDDYPVLIPEKELITGNYIVIGAMVNRRKFNDVGGFRELAAFEDWDLWMRMVYQADATIGKCPDAVYRILVRPDSRNQTNDSLFKQLQLDYLRQGWL